MNPSIIAQFSKFVVVGLVNTAIDFGVLNLLVFLTGIETGIGIAVLNSIAFAAAVTNSYFMNKHWTFGVKGEAAKTTEVSKFLLISLIGLGINSGIVYGVTNFVTPPFVEIGPVSWINLSKVIATGLSLIWNFSGYKFLVFKR
jgi:glycosyltransferase AglD